MNLLFDTEGNGLLHDLTVMHSLVILDADDGELVASCADQPGYMPILEGLELLDAADYVIGHYIEGYDLKAIRKLYKRTVRAIPIDTLRMSRLLFPDLRVVDQGLVRAGVLPAHLIGRHSLEAWGFRLGRHKGTFGKTSNWQTWSEDMQLYCCDDTLTNYDLWKFLLAEEEAQVASGSAPRDTPASAT